MTRTAPPTAMLEALAAVTVGALPPPSDPAPGAPAIDGDPATGWLRLDGLTEKVLGGEGALSPAPRVGEVRTYHDEIYTSDGELIGTTEGRLEIIRERAEDGHMIAVRSERVLLFDEELHFCGLNDMTEEFAGGWVSVPGIGVSGRYLGASAVRRIRMTPTPMVSEVFMTLAP